MYGITSSSLRFRQFRESAGLSQNDVAHFMGISSSCIWDIETQEGELSSVYSPLQIQSFSRILGVQPMAFFGDEVAGTPVSVTQLVLLIRQECKSRGITLEQFENVVGWRLSACIEPPELLLKNITIDGLQWLCRELAMDWRLAISGL